MALFNTLFIWSILIVLMKSCSSDSSDSLSTSLDSDSSAAENSESSSTSLESALSAGSSKVKDNNKYKKKSAVVTESACTIYKEKKNEPVEFRYFNATTEWCAKMTYLCNELESFSGMSPKVKWDKQASKLMRLTGHELCCPDLSTACPGIYCMDSENCDCPAGTTQDGHACVDIDECAEGLDDCHEFANCINIEGSYMCECIEPRIGDGVNDCVVCDEVVGWYIVDQLCIAPVNVKRTWSVSGTICGLFGGRLIELDTDYKFTVVAEWLDSHPQSVLDIMTPLWLGATYDDTVGSFVWTDSGVPVDPYDHWNVGSTPVYGAPGQSVSADISGEPDIIGYAADSSTLKRHAFCRFLG